MAFSNSGNKNKNSKKSKVVIVENDPQLVSGRLILNLVGTNGSIELPVVSLYDDNHMFTTKAQQQLIKLAKHIEDGNKFDLSKLKVEVVHGWTAYTNGDIQSVEEGVHTLFGEDSLEGFTPDKDDDDITDLMDDDDLSDFALNHRGYLNLSLMNSAGVGYKLKALPLSLNGKSWERALLLYAKAQASKDSEFKFENFLDEFSIEVIALESVPLEEDMAMEDFFNL